MSRLIMAAAGVLLCAAAVAGEPDEAPPPTFAASDPVLIRLGLSADQAKKVNDLAADYAKKAAALPKDAKSEDRKALAAERSGKIREALSAAQQPKFDAGLPIVADYDAKVLALQQESSRLMMSTPRDQIEKRRENIKVYREKRAVLDADFNKKLDEQVGKRPEAPKTETKQ
jgi:hypothetical protein